MEMDATGLIVLDLRDRLLNEGLAARTVQEYTKWARRLARWCDLHGHDLVELEPYQLREWADTSFSPGRECRKQAHAAVKHLYTMLGREDEAPWLAIRVPSKRPGNPWPLKDGEAARLRDSALMVGGRRGVATLGLLFTGARPGEVASWRWDGIDEEERTIRFWREKVRDWHLVPLHEILHDELERFRGPWAPEGFMFPGDRGRPHVGPTTVWTWVRSVAAAGGLQNVTPRRLRATAGSHALEATGDIDAVAELLGHRDVSTTRRYYTSTSRRRLAAAVTALDYGKAGPISN